MNTFIQQFTGSKPRNITDIRLAIQAKLQENIATYQHTLPVDREQEFISNVYTTQMVQRQQKVLSLYKNSRIVEFIRILPTPNNIEILNDSTSC